MLPPHPPFVQKIVKRRIVRRSPQETLLEIAGDASDAGRETGRVWRRASRRLKPALKVLEQPRAGNQG